MYVKIFELHGGANLYDFLAIYIVRISPTPLYRVNFTPERTTRPHFKESTGSSAQTELEMGGDTLRLPGATMRRNTSSSSSMMKRGRNNTTLLNVKSILTDRRNKVYS